MTTPLPPLLPAPDWLRVRVLSGLAAVGGGVVVALLDGLGPLPLALVGAGLLLALSGVPLRRPGADPLPAFFVDIIALTVVLACSGGPANPLVALYLVPVLVGALVLSAGWTWAVCGATGIGYGSLFLIAPSPHMGHAGMAGHLVGMFAVHAATAPVVALALLHARRVKARAAAQEREAQAMRARSERLTALATLAAGAAHELASPLSTILVVARELERRSTSPEDVDDALLVRDEVVRCQEILHQLSADAGQGMGEVRQAVVVDELLVEVAAGAADLEWAPCPAEVALPRRLVVQALRRLIGNARLAGGAAPIQIATQIDGDVVRFSVRDFGVGMAPEVRERAIEPFFTTRPEGQGSGLGLYFVHSVAVALGGELVLQSTPGAGTTATLCIPLEQA